MLFVVYNAVFTYSQYHYHKLTLAKLHFCTRPYPDKLYLATTTTNANTTNLAFISDGSKRFRVI
jgi:hypothetical protein